MATIGFLHTSAVHSEAFESLVDEISPGTEVVSVVDEVLLDRARSHGLTDLMLIGGLADRLAELAEVDVVVCTCSTIGGLAEQVGEQAGVRVNRVDRAMAEHAVTVGGRVALIVAVESTVGPTAEVVEAVAAERGVEVEVEVHVADGAWTKFECGDLAGYESLVAETVRRCRSASDVIVLAQASMWAVADRPDLAGIAVPVLASPRLAVTAALAGL